MQGEDAIRLYLTFLSDPEKLIDRAVLKKLESAVETAKDPVEQLIARGALDRARNIDGNEQRDEFIRIAKAWADSERIPVSAFVQMGVPADVLDAAGFDVPGMRKRAGKASGPSTRRRSVGSAEIREYVMAQRQTFTTGGIQGHVGGSPGTIKKVLDEMVTAGTIARLGPVPGWANRGRAPYQYGPA